MMTLQTNTLMHNIEARPYVVTARRRRPNYNLKFNLYYKNRPLRSVNVFARRPSTARPARSESQLLKLTDISQILKSIVPGPLVAYYTNMT